MQSVYCGCPSASTEMSTVLRDIHTCALTSVDSKSALCAMWAVPDTPLGHSVKLCSRGSARPLSVRLFHVTMDCMWTGWEERDPSQKVGTLSFEWSVGSWGSRVGYCIVVIQMTVASFDEIIHDGEWLDEIIHDCKGCGLFNWCMLTLVITFVSVCKEAVNWSVLVRSEQKKMTPVLKSDMVCFSL